MTVDLDAIANARVRTILQARCSSRRLPRKVLSDLGGRPMILRQLERVTRARAAADLVVATSVEPSDDELAAEVESAGYRVHRGSLEDVLGRFVEVLGDAEHIVRLTGDCPLADPDVIDLVVATHLERGDDYTTNAVELSFPHGLDVEVVRASALREADTQSTERAEREHVMPYVYRRPERFRSGHVHCERYLWHHRWTVDEPEDLEFVRAVYAQLGDRWSQASWRDVLALVEEHPELERINAHLVDTSALPSSSDEDRS